MGYRADIAGYDRTGKLVLAVEAKAKGGASPDWAAKLRRNLLAHGVVSESPYFLLALPDHFYLWKAQPSGSLERQPDYDVDPTPLLRPYFERSGVSPLRVSGGSFELILGSLLQDLLNTPDLSGPIAQNNPWLVESGLHSQLRGGRIAYEVAA